MSSMVLQILGAGPAYSDVPGAVGASYLVRADDAALLLDLGQGAFPALAMALEPSRLHAVLISHLHPDHFIDLIALRHYLRRMEFQPPRRLRLIAPAGIERLLDGAYDQPGFSAGAFDVGEPFSGPLRVGPFVVERALVRHTDESYALRVSLDGSPVPGLVYSGDLGSPNELRPLIRPGDLLLCEASFGPGRVPVGMAHLDAAGAAAAARDGGAAHLVLTHLRIGTDPVRTLAAARDGFGGAISLASPGARYAV